MRIPRPPFFGILQDLLYTLFLQGECVGFEVLQVNSFVPQQLTIPSEAQYALIIIRSDANAPDKNYVVNILEADPNIFFVSNGGFPLGDFGKYQVSGKENMKNTRLIAVDGYTHNAYIQYFG